MAERVALGTVNVMGNIKGKSVNIITEQDISERAFRSCPVGSAACLGCLIDVVALSAAYLNDGEVEVHMMAERIQGCGASDERLQQSLDRLHVQSQPIEKK